MLRCVRSYVQLYAIAFTLSAETKPQFGRNLSYLSCFLLHSALRRSRLAISCLIYYTCSLDSYLVYYNYSLFIWGSNYLLMMGIALLFIYLVYEVNNGVPFSYLLICCIQLRWTAFKQLTDPASAAETSTRMLSPVIGRRS